VAVQAPALRLVQGPEAREGGPRQSLRVRAHRGVAAAISRARKAPGGHGRVLRHSPDLYLPLASSLVPPLFPPSLPLPPSFLPPRPLPSHTVRFFATCLSSKALPTVCSCPPLRWSPGDSQVPAGAPTEVLEREARAEGDTAKARQVCAEVRSAVALWHCDTVTL